MVAEQVPTEKRCSSGSGPEAVAEAPTRGQEEPPFETVASSVSDLRSLIACLETPEPITTRSQRREDKACAQREGGLLEELHRLLTELEPQETKLQQAEMAVRIKLHKEWHRTIPEGQESDDGEASCVTLVAEDYEL